MKLFKGLILLSLLVISQKLSAQQIAKAELQVTGLTCSMCSQATEKSLRTLDFINSITPDLNRNVFVLTFKKDRNVNLDLIRRKVEDAGFSIGNLSATFNFNNVKVDSKGLAVASGKVYQLSSTKNKVLNGTIKAAVVDKNFVSSSKSKQWASKFQSETYASGTGVIDGKKTRVYHLDI